MKLRDIARKIKEDDQPDFSFALPGGTEISELTPEMIADFPENVYIANSQSVIFGKTQKSTLLYLMERQRSFHFQQILDSMSDGVIAVDENGRVFYANSAYASILGVPRRRIMGRLIQDIEPQSLLSQAVAKRTTMTSDKQLISSIQKYVSLRAVPLWEGEQFLGVVSFFHDVTKIHHLDQEIRQMSGIVDEYSNRIRTQEIAEKIGLASYSKSFQTTIQKAATVALADVPILISGEAGTGKNSMAYYLHLCSNRREKPFLVISCAAVPENMMEAELFGDGDRPGKLKLADGGTLFLDDIEELPLSMQSRLLYYIKQDTEIDVGVPSVPAADTRIIAASGQPLEPLVESRRFRQELFFRLNAFTIDLPPLRERRDDIIPLTNQFLSECNQKYHRHVTFSPQVYQKLRKYDWPGNLQELKSYVERAVILTAGNSVIEWDGRGESESAEEKNTQVISADRPLAEQMHEFEQKVIAETLKACGGNRTAAMERLGLSRRTFYRKCEKLPQSESVK